jgi:hypothetical protein
MRLRRATTLATLLTAVVACALLGVSTWHTVEQHRLLERTAIPSPPGIERLESLQLGGAEQWILVRGTDVHAPVLLWLHGGPGDPSIPRARVTDGELVKHFLVVHWDQRGAGKSLTAGFGRGALTIERLVADACELAGVLSGRFGGHRIVLGDWVGTGRGWRRASTSALSAGRGQRTVRSTAKGALRARASSRSRDPPNTFGDFGADEIYRKEKSG